MFIFVLSEIENRKERRRKISHVCKTLSIFMALFHVSDNTAQKKIMCVELIKLDFDGDSMSTERKSIN